MPTVRQYTPARNVSKISLLTFYYDACLFLFNVLIYVLMRDKSTIIAAIQFIAGICGNMNAAYLFLLFGSPSLLELLNRTALCILYAFVGIMFQREERQHD